MKTGTPLAGGIFDQGRTAVIVSLPQNSVELAVAAAGAGADALKIHLNVEHAASGTKFGSYEEERDNVEAIIEAVDIPVGIMPGAGVTASLAEMAALEKLGVAFYDIYIHDMPAAYMQIVSMTPMAALAPGWQPWQAGQLTALGIPTVEASIVDHSLYGSPLRMTDLLAYSAITSAFSGKVVVPTQKAIAPSEIPALRGAGVDGIMIGKIVTGDTADSIARATARFAAAAAK